jgi:hypothetical protein
MRVPQVSERIKEAPAQALRGVFAGIGQLLLITDKLRNKTPAGQDVRRARTSGASETVPTTTAASPAGQREEPATVAAEPALAEPAASGSATAETVAAESAAAKPATARRAPAKPATAKPATKPAAKPTTARRSPARPATAKAAPAKPAATEPPKPPKRQSTRDFDKTGNVRLLGDQADSSPLSAAAAASPVPTPLAEPAAAPEPAAAAAEPVSAPEPISAPEPASTAEPARSPADSAPPLPNYDELSVASLRARLRNLDVAQVGQLADYERAHAARADVLAMFERRIAKLEAEA